MGHICYPICYMSHRLHSTLTLASIGDFIIINFNNCRRQQTSKEYTHNSVEILYIRGNQGTEQLEFPLATCD